MEFLSRELSSFSQSVKVKEKINRNSLFLLFRFGETNQLFNQLITHIVQSFENKYYHSQMMDFINQYPSSSQTQQLAIDQILLNVEWLNNGMAEYLDDAISAGDRRHTKK